MAGLVVLQLLLLLQEALGSNEILPSATLDVLERESYYRAVSLSMSCGQYAIRLISVNRAAIRAGNNCLQDCSPRLSSVNR